MEIRILLVVVLSISYSGLSYGHVFRTGACPQVEVVENFNFEKFRGKWFVIEKSQTTSSCMQYNFTVKNDDTPTVIEKYRLFGVKVFNNWNDFTQTGNLVIPTDTPAKMTVQFPFSLNPFSPVSFWVTGTDYDSYAAVWSCRRFLFGHFQSAMILSRNSTLDRQILNKMKSRFDFFGVHRSDFSVVDQNDCQDKKAEKPEDEFKEILTSTTSLRPSVVVTTVAATNETELFFGGAVPPVVISDGNNKSPSTTPQTVIKEVEPTSEKEPEPLDSDNMP